MIATEATGSGVLLPLWGGMHATIDEDDFKLASLHHWHVAKNKRMLYARGYIGGKNIALHRLILGFPAVRIDHIDGNGLNNRKSNLRMCTNSQNMANVIRISSNTSGYKGVHRRGKKWCAGICVNYKNIWIGTFDTAQEAAAAYDAFAISSFGPFAKTNRALGLLKETP